MAPPTAACCATPSKVDFFKGLNVSSIVLLLPNAELGGNGKTVGVSANTAVLKDGTWVQIDQMGRPGFSTVFNNHLVTGDASVNSVKELFNRTLPSEQTALGFKANVIATLKAVSTAFEHPYTDKQASDLANVLVPDLLTYKVGDKSGLPQRTPAHRRRHRHPARGRGEHARRQRLHRERLHVPGSFPFSPRRTSAHAGGRGTAGPPAPTSQSDRSTTVTKAIVPSQPLPAHPARRARRRRCRATGSRARRRRARTASRLIGTGRTRSPSPTSRWPAGTGDRRRRTRPTRTSGSRSGRTRIEANPPATSQYQYLGELFALKGRETGDVSQYALAERHSRGARAVPRQHAARAGLARNLVTLHRVEGGDRRGDRDPAGGPARARSGCGHRRCESRDRRSRHGPAAFETLREKPDGPAVDDPVRAPRLPARRHRRTRSASLDEAAAHGDGTQRVGRGAGVLPLRRPGSTASAQGDVEGAEREYRAASRSFPNYYLALAGRGRVAFAQGDVDGAIDCLQVGRRDHPQARAAGLPGRPVRDARGRDGRRAAVQGRRLHRGTRRRAGGGLQPRARPVPGDPPARYRQRGDARPAELRAQGHLRLRRARVGAVQRRSRGGGPGSRPPGPGARDEGSEGPCHRR